MADAARTAGGPNGISAAWFGVTGADVGPALGAGAIIALLVLVTSVSYPSLIFAGELAPYAPMGVRMGLFTAVVFCLVLAFSSSYPGAVGVARAEPAVVLGVIAASMAETIEQTGAARQLLPTVLVTVTLSAVLTAGCFALLGAFRLGNLIRFVPFPVIGGFLAGIGWLMVEGAFRAMTGHTLSLQHLPELALPGELMRWLPGVILAGLLVLLQNRRRHALNLPGVLLGTVLLFWAVAWIAGAAPAQLQEAGWLLGVAGGGGPSWVPARHLADMAEADWGLIVRHAPQLGSLVIISVITLLLTASSVELVARRDIDLNRELLAAGGANLLSALGGALPGYHSLNGCTLAARLGTPIRLVGILSAVLCGLAFAFGTSLLNLVPKILVGVVLLYTGGGLLIEWLYQSRPRLSVGEYLVLLLVFAGVGFVGILEGVALGIGAGTVLFVINYSRTSMVRRIASGATLHSNVQRPESLSGLLREHGDEIHVLVLQGYLFFGTANRLLEGIRQRMAAPEAGPLRCIILDFARVTGIDSSAVASFTKLAQYAEQGGFSVVFSALPPEIAGVLRQAGLSDEGHPVVLTVPDLDRGLEHGEERVIAARALAPAAYVDPLEQQLRRAFPGSPEIERVLDYVERIVLPPGKQLIRQGDASDDLFFIESGRVTVNLHLAEGGEVRLGAMGAGTVVGEVALYLGLPRSASVRADVATVAYRLSRGGLSRMAAERPQVAAMFHEFMARVLAARVLDTNYLLEGYRD